MENSRILLFDYCFNSVTILSLGILIPFSVVEFLLLANTMKSFLERLAGGRRSFRDLAMGETAALSLSKGMRSPAFLKRDVNKSLKKQAREPRNERKGFMVFAYSN